MSDFTYRIKRESQSPVGSFADEWRLIQSARNVSEEQHGHSDDYLPTTYRYNAMSNPIPIAPYSVAVPSDTSTSFSSDGGQFDPYIQRPVPVDGFTTGPSYAPVNIHGLAPETGSPSTIYEPSTPVSPREVLRDQQAFPATCPSPLHASESDHDGGGSFFGQVYPYATTDPGQHAANGTIHPGPQSYPLNYQVNYNHGYTLPFRQHPSGVRRVIGPSVDCAMQQNQYWGHNDIGAVGQVKQFGLTAQAEGPTGLGIDTFDEDHASNSSREPEPFLESQEADEREEQNRFLVQCRRKGMSYREIRKKGGFREAESTLRGRFRDLTKPKEERLRRPEWTCHDVSLRCFPSQDRMRREHGG